MKFKLTLLWLGFYATAQAAGIATPEGSTVSRSGFQSVISAITAYQDIRQTLEEKRIALNFEENLAFPSLIEIERLEAEIEIKNREIDELSEQFLDVINRSNNQQYDESDEQVAESLIADARDQLTTLENEKADYYSIYEGRKTRQQENIRSLKEDLDNLTEEQAKQRQIIQLEISRFMSYVVAFIALFILFLALKLVSRGMINRLAKTYSEPRQKALHRLNNIVFNLLLALIVLGVVFSQFVNLLPFLAILGTGLAFAVRDTISSFIGWFVIGSERGYRTGDLIEIGNIKGRVIEIKPLLTVLSDLTPGWHTGKIITIPNKIIFEDKIFNHSRSGNISVKTVEFLLTEDSDLDESKALLIKAFSGLTLPEKLPKNTNQSLGLDPTLRPKVWIESSIHGLELKGRFLTLDQHKEINYQNVQENFTKAVQKSEKVHFQLVEAGHQTRSKDAKPTTNNHNH